MGIFKTFMDPDADFRKRARERKAALEIKMVEQKAKDADKRADKMSRKIVGGGRRAAKAAVRADVLHDRADRQRAQNDV